MLGGSLANIWNQLEQRNNVTARYETWFSPGSTSKSLTKKQRHGPIRDLVFTKLGIESLTKKQHHGSIRDLVFTRLDIEKLD
jgi:hypothetical protein